MATSEGIPPEDRESLKWIDWPALVSGLTEANKRIRVENENLALQIDRMRKLQVRDAELIAKLQAQVKDLEERFKGADLPSGGS